MTIFDGNFIDLCLNLKIFIQRNLFTSVRKFILTYHNINVVNLYNEGRNNILV